ncbi:hypothetical protein NL676_031258 [Syzygium grande]|nr:hypothetical protein NL676_031258 [Syzygium grande]
MAAARRVSSRLVELVSSPNPIVSPARLIFHRGLASTLFVKGIDFATTEDRLAKAFSKFGQVEEGKLQYFPFRASRSIIISYHEATFLPAKIIMDRVKNRSKGFGYVTFAVEEDARKALIDMNGKLLDGRVVFVDKARTRRDVDHSVPKARGPPEPSINE